MTTKCSVDVSSASLVSECTPSAIENTAPEMKIPTAASSDQKNRSLP